MYFFIHLLLQMTATVNTISSISSVNNTMTLLDIAREEGRRLPATHCGFKYIMARLGKFGDFKAGRILFIRRKQRRGATANLLHPGGKVTYAQLVAEGKSDDDIEKIFNARRRTYDAMKEGSYRSKMYEEFQKMITNFNSDDYYAGKPASMLSADVEKHSKGRRPENRTTFCEAVARMMTLVRLAHQKSSNDARNWKTTQLKEAKRVANDKRTTKHNAMKDSMGLAAWNAKKRRDQAASEVRKAAEVSARPKQESDFLAFRRSAKGRQYDSAPAAGYVVGLAGRKRGWVAVPTTKRLGYTSRATLALLVKKHVLDSKASNFEIVFQVDPCDSKTQLFQHVAMGDGVSPLSKTQEVSSNRTFRISGYYHKPYAASPENNGFYVNLDDMRASVYMGLPTKYKAFEAWEKYGVKGNPKKSTMMKILFKITPFNIQKFSFVREETRYIAEYTSNSGMQRSMVELEAKMADKLDMAAAAAALLAEEEKRRRAHAARAREAAWKKAEEARARVERSARAASMRPLGSDHQGIFDQFFGVGMQKDVARERAAEAKANLAMLLAAGKISQDTFNAAMSALQ